ncbi:alpha/beta fold hydrolase [Nocardia puris]|uniref:Alpha/beta hydrolase family protein n=1 Tax=Nocardia puris TaxID=208602 RepID=A0A366E4E2_9NOCA|nr:hypothetical protein [Nocardia puris]RBO96374.1 hypothetical protein DFR74_101389 [Nocardia puris]
MHRVFHAVDLGAARRSSGGEDGADNGLVAVDLGQPEGEDIAHGERAGGEAEDVGGVGAQGGIEGAAVVRADLETGRRSAELVRRAADVETDIWGDADIAFRPQERERLESTFPHHKTVIIEGAGTYPESDAPEEFVAALQDWAELPDTGAVDR